MSLSIFVYDNAESMSRQAAKRVFQALTAQPDMLLCAAGGSTPLRAYELLVQRLTSQPGGGQSLRLVKLDEWGGLDLNDPGTCEVQLQTHLIAPLHLKANRYLGFNSNPTDAQAECERIRRRLTKEGPIDFAVLGLGRNGHIAMNEPGPGLQPFAHVAQLAEPTRRHPMLEKSRIKPSFGLTLGMAEILAARQILLLVSGAGKCSPLQKLCRREITSEFPASFLWLHPNCTVLCDRDAAEGLETPA